MVVLAALLAACSTGTQLVDEKITVACGMCIFKIEPFTGCYWAAEVEGGHVPVTGPAIPMDHEAHGPGGMCTMPREAVVSGTRYDDKIIADSFELVAVDKVAPAPAHDHEH